MGRKTYTYNNNNIMKRTASQLKYSVYNTHTHTHKFETNCVGVPATRFRMQAVRVGAREYVDNADVYIH